MLKMTFSEHLQIYMTTYRSIGLLDVRKVLVHRRISNPFSSVTQLAHDGAACKITIWAKTGEIFTVLCSKAKATSTRDPTWCKLLVYHCCEARIDFHLEDNHSIQ